MQRQRSWRQTYSTSAQRGSYSRARRAPKRSPRCIAGLQRDALQFHLVIRHVGTMRLPHAHTASTSQTLHEFAMNRSAPAVALRHLLVDLEREHEPNDGVLKQIASEPLTCVLPEWPNDGTCVLCCCPERNAWGCLHVGLVSDHRSLECKLDVLPTKNEQLTF